MNFRPICFATEHGSLYGVHHFPADGRANERAVLIMPPMGQEYVRCHKTLQKLAVDLAEVGFHALRFDYVSTGDSSDLDDWDLETWKRNSLDALRELSVRGQTDRLSIIGVRLGASLAISLDATLDSLVAWDPVSSGQDYLTELNALNAELLETTLHSLRRGSRSREVPDERLGHRFPRSMQESLRNFTLEANLNARSSHMLWLESSDQPRSETPLPIADELMNNWQWQHHRLAMKCQWNSRTELEKTLMGQPAIRVILEFLDNRHAHEGRSA